MKAFSLANILEMNIKRKIEDGVEFVPGQLRSLALSVLQASRCYVVSKTSESSSFASKNKSLQSPVRATAQLASASKKAKNASGSSDEKKSDKTPATVDKKATQIAPADSDAIPSSSRGMLLQKFYDAEEAADNAEKKTAKHLKNKKVSPPVKPAPKSPSSDSSKSSSEIESSSESESASDSDSSSESSGNFSA